MSISLLVAALGCLGAAAATGLLVAKCLRVPGGALIAWTVAMFGLAVSLAAQAVGHGLGFGPVAFRAMEIGTGIIAPLALVGGLTEVAGKNVATRFAARLVLPAIAFVSLVIFGSDPLSIALFSKAWPDPQLYYQIIPNDLLKYLITPVTVVIALLALGWTAVRARRDHGWQDALPPVAGAAAAAIALSVPGLAAAAGGNAVGSWHVGSLFALLCAAAAALTWFACSRISKLRPRLLPEPVGPEEADEWALQHEWTGGPAETGDFEPLGGAADPYGSLYRHRADPEYDDWAAYPGGGVGDYASNGTYRADAGYGDETGHGDSARDFDALDASRSGAWQAAPAGGGQPRPDEFGGYEAPRAGGDGRAGARLFGQIAIYTLLEDRVKEFDRLTRQVVNEVRANEPDTLVFIVHAVPSAPMQRILYEVYRDRAAYEEHKRQPYVAGFENDRRPYVLATNLIELGLQQAKVSPLPSISDLLSDTGYDLLSDSGYGQPGFGPRPVVPGGSGTPGGGVPGGGVPGSGVPGTGVPGTGVPGTGVPGGSAPGGSGRPGGGPPGAHRSR